ncbi:hypothetical protein ATE92_2041 [Ulvibacter sp. MAR_2010_11]|nr:hypothetical protein ATE92_2041 [Ulvibacter sp. MAR_2010_11]
MWDFNFLTFKVLCPSLNVKFNICPAKSLATRHILIDLLKYNDLLITNL